MSNQLLPCPFCGDSQFSKVDMTYFHQTGPVKGFRIKCGTCGAQAPDTCWNHRATQPAAGEPIGKVELFGINMTYFEWRERKMPPLGTELYAAPPAAAHGDEAVRKDAERYRWISANVIEAEVGRSSEFHTDWRRAWKLPLLLSQNAVAATFTFDEAIDAAMRAQGDGESV